MNKDIQEIMEELWDEFSKYVDDDIDSLSEVAGTLVITEPDFKRLVKELKKKIKPLKK